MPDTGMFTIKIKNFQSLSEAELRLEDGLTIVTGPTNNGKSAIVRALESAVFNDGVDEYIKAGTDGLSVFLDNGTHQVEYCRKAKGRTDKTTYRFDGGEAQQKVGRTQLPEMERFFNILEVRLQNNQKARLNFWYQNGMPFLMDKTAGQLYEFLSVSSSEKYLATLKAMSFDMKQEDADIKTATLSIDMLKKELSRKQDILDRNRGFHDVYDRLSVLKQEDARVEKVGTLALLVEEAQKVSAAAQESLRRVTARLAAIPMEDVAGAVGRVVSGHKELAVSVELAGNVEGVHKTLSAAKERLCRVIARLEADSKWLAEAGERMARIDMLQASVAALAAQETACEEANGKAERCRERVRALPAARIGLSGMSGLQERIAFVEKENRWLSERRKEVTAVMEAASKMKTAQEALKASVARLDSSDKEFVALKEELGVCPFCGAVFGSPDV